MFTWPLTPNPLVQLGKSSHSKGTEVDCLNPAQWHACTCNPSCFGGWARRAHCSCLKEKEGRMEGTGGEGEERDRGRFKRGMGELKRGNGKRG